MTRRMKLTAAIFATTIFAMSMPAMADYYTTPDGAIVLDIPDQSWSEIQDEYTLTTLSNGTGTITVLRYDANGALPAVAVPSANYAASYQAVMADNKDVYVITGSATSKEYLPAVKKIVQSATYYEENPYAGPVDTTSAETVATTYDVQSALSLAEQSAAAIQQQLQSDASLTQTDLNSLTYDVYMIWDNALNEIWQVLNETLDQTTMSGLVSEQMAWISKKESEAQQAGAAYAGGSMASMVINQKAAELTKTRVYELAAYLY